MQSCLVDFDLTDDGTFRLKQFGEQTAPEILERGHPMLDKALEGEAFTEHAIESAADPQPYDSAATEIRRNAVKAERGRLKDFQRTSATTERGKDLQRQVGGSGAYVDAIVEQAASQHLRRYKPRKKSKPIGSHRRSDETRVRPQGYAAGGIPAACDDSSVLNLRQTRSRGTTAQLSWTGASD